MKRQRRLWCKAVACSLLTLGLMMPTAAIAAEGDVPVGNPPAAVIEQASGEGLTDSVLASDQQNSIGEGSAVVGESSGNAVDNSAVDVNATSDEQKPTDVGSGEGESTDGQSGSVDSGAADTQTSGDVTEGLTAAESSSQEQGEQTLAEGNDEASANSEVDAQENAEASTPAAVDEAAAPSESQDAAASQAVQDETHEQEEVIVSKSSNASATTKAANTNAATPVKRASGTEANETAGNNYAVRNTNSASYMVGLTGGANTKSGTTVSMQKLGSSLSLRWAFTDAGNGLVYIKNIYSGLYMGVKDGKKATGAAVLQEVLAKTTAQKWQPVKNSNGYWVLASALANTGGKSTWLVLSTKYGASKAGNPLVLAKYSTTAAGQQWELRLDKTERVTAANDIAAFAAKHKGTLKNGDEVMLSPNTGKFLLAGVASASKGNKANVRVATSVASNAQVWRVKTDSKGYVTLINKNSGKAITVTGGKATSGTNVTQYSSTGSRAQKWVAVADSAGNITFWSALGRAMVLDTADKGTKSGSNIAISDVKISSCSKYDVVKHYEAKKYGKSIANGYYTVYLPGTSTVAGVKNGSVSNKAAVQTTQRFGYLSQVFRIVYCSDGFYRILGINAHRNLSVGKNMLPGANAFQETIDNTLLGQKWSIVKNGASYKIISALTGHALGSTTVTPGKTLSTNDGLEQGLWRFEKATPNVVTGVYKMVSSLDHKSVLEVEGASKVAAAEVQVNSSTTSMAQRFYVEKQNDGNYTIESVNSAMQLSAVTDGKVTQRKSATDSNQLWKITYSPYGYRFVNVNTGKAISLAKSTAQTKASQSTSNSAGQGFALTTVRAYDDGVSFLNTALSSKYVLRTVEGSTKAGAAASLDTKNEKTDPKSQKWFVKTDEDGYVTFSNIKSGLVLGLKGGTAKSSATVEQQTQSTDFSQRWAITYVGGGRYVITNAEDATLALTVKGGAATSGAVVHIVKKTGATAQSWTLEKTKAGVVIAIDPGHGGNDSGAAANGLRECDLTWAISQACAKQLKAYGYDVYITRGKNESVSVKDRVTRAKAHDAEAIFSMHINAGGGHGAVVLVPNSSSYNKQFYTMGQKFANTLLPKINKIGISTWSDGAWERNYATYEGADENQYYKGGGYADYYGIVRYARLLDMFGVIIEHGFIDSSDANILRQTSVQSALGKADAEAIYQVIGL